MCGVVGYIGNEDAVPILIDGLKRLEYRGYDSAGIATAENGDVQLLKCEGKVADLEKLLDESTVRGNVGIGHTRWATHGVPSDLNAHPHSDMSGKISLIHNGIIENYNTLREALEKEGVIFSTETDTEVLVQLIGKVYASDSLTFSEAVQSALQDVVGTYGIAAICSDEPETVIGARLGSPLVLGVGENENFLASDASPIIPHTRNVVYLDDGDLVEMKRDSYEVRRIRDNSPINKVMEQIEYNLEEIEKGGYPHFMLKEIHEQTNTLTDTMRGRLSPESGTAHLGGIADFLPRIENASRIYITACGTSWHAAGIVGPLRATPNLTHLAMYAGELFPRLEAETGLSTGYRRTGGYWIARDPARMDELHRIAALGRHVGLTPTVVPPQSIDVPGLSLDGVAGALRVEEDANVNPVDLCMAYARAAGRDDVRVRAVPAWALRAGGVVNADVRAMAEMSYLFTEPLLVDEGATIMPATPLDVAAAAVVDPASRSTVARP